LQAGAIGCNRLHRARPHGPIRPLFFAAPKPGFRKLHGCAVAEG
jgi:hypothetical protein